MKIAEIFHSIQGEGILAGTPSVFVRTSGCNLRCTWCDTPYTSWEPEGKTWKLGTLLGAVRKFWAHHTVVTGGEPMIDPEIVRFTEGLHEIHQHVTIETAGTVFEPVQCDLMSISPKLSNSTPRTRDGGRWAEQHDRLRIQPDVLKELMKSYEYQLKFVIQAKEDVAEARDLVEKLEADSSRVLLMPEGIDAATLTERSRWLVDYCKVRNYRFSPRLHIDLYGNQRGT